MKNLIQTAVHHSLVPSFKLDFLRQAVVNSPQNGDILEIGCYKGGSSLVLASTLLEKNPNQKIYICDTFTGIALAGENDNHHKDGDFSDTSPEQVKYLLQSNGLFNFEILKGIFPNDTAHLLPTDLKLSAVHIDVDVYNGYKACLNFCLGKLLDGAYIVLDDFGASTCQGATKAVFEFLEQNSEFEPHFTENLGFGVNYLVYRRRK